MNEEISFAQYLDLRGTPCHLNFVRCRLALEKLSLNDRLKVDLDPGEPESMVIPGLRQEGFSVEIVNQHSRWVRLLVTFGVR